MLYKSRKEALRNSSEIKMYQPIEVLEATSNS